MESLDTLASYKAEEIIIGSVMMEPRKSLQLLIEMDCCADWFFHPAYQIIWRLSLELYENGKPVDVVSVNDLAVKKGVNKDVALYPQKCAESYITIAHLRFYAEEVREYHNKRKQRDIFTKYMEQLVSEKSSIEITSNLKMELDDIKYNSEETKTKKEIESSIKKRSDICDNDGFLGVSSRWLSLQRKLGGYRKGKMCILAARPSVGKTTFALNETRAQAENGYKVGWISLETEIEELYETMAAEKAEISLFERDNGDISIMQADKFKHSIEEVMTLPVYVTDKSMGIGHICNWIHYMSSKVGLDIVYLDYIQIISDTPGLKFKSMREKIAYYSKKLFAAARDNNIALVVLCQISRAGEVPANIKAEDRWRFTPKLHHLKESGALEEDAFQCVILYDDPQEEVLDGSFTVPFIADVAKNKRGPKGKVEMLYRKNVQKITMRDI